MLFEFMVVFLIIKFYSVGDERVELLEKIWGCGLEREDGLK